MCLQPTALVIPKHRQRRREDHALSPAPSDKKALMNIYESNACKDDDLSDPDRLYNRNLRITGVVHRNPELGRLQATTSHTSDMFSTSPSSMTWHLMPSYLNPIYRSYIDGGELAIDQEWGGTDLAYWDAYNSHTACDTQRAFQMA